MSHPSSDPSAVTSPFDESRAEVAPQRAKPKRVWWLAGIIAIVVAIGAVLLMRFLNEPLRTLETFPTDKYFSSYQALQGAKFKGRLRVDADLGFKPDRGRLMVFTAETDSRPLVVFIPANLAGQYFNKGQFYLMQLDVREGGIIYASTCVKD
jgi:hypothetical protein